jgi:phage shock protein C
MSLARSRSDRKIAGVCGGIAERLSVSSTSVRIAFVVAVLLAGLSAWTYLVAWILMPEYRD